jgi:hypothetical protein
VPFHNQPFHLAVPATRSYPVRLGDISTVVRYVPSHAEADFRPRVRAVWRSGTLPLSNEKLGPRWQIKVLGSDASGHLLEIAFLGEALAKAIASAPDKCNEDRNLYNAILDRAVVDLELELGQDKPNDEDLKRGIQPGVCIATLRLKLEPKFP